MYFFYQTPPDGLDRLDITMFTDCSHGRVVNCHHIQFSQFSTLFPLPFITGIPEIFFIVLSPLASYSDRSSLQLACLSSGPSCQRSLPGWTETGRWWGWWGSWGWWPGTRGSHSRSETSNTQSAHWSSNLSNKLQSLFLTPLTDPAIQQLISLSHPTSLIQPN